MHRFIIFVSLLVISSAVQDLTFDTKSRMIPHNDKKDRGGEDAYYIGDNILVVADGVGGWAKKGVNPGFFSRRLVQLIGEQHAADPRADMKGVLVSSCKQAEAEFLGSATAVIAYFDPEEGGKLHTVNLGDSGYMIFRIELKESAEGGGKQEVNMARIYRSSEQQYAFNFPFQCGTGHPDAAEKADVMTHEVKEGDIVLMASDGMFDNLFEKQIKQCLGRNMKKGAKIDLQGGANCLAENAIQLSLQKDKITPFAQNAKRHGKQHKGGKHDDTTVLLAEVKRVGWESDLQQGEATQPNSDSSILEEPLAAEDGHQHGEL